MEFELVFRYILQLSMLLIGLMLYSGLLSGLLSTVRETIIEIKQGDNDLITKVMLIFFILIFTIAVAFPCWFVCSILEGGIK